MAARVSPVARRLTRGRNGLVLLPGLAAVSLAVVSITLAACGLGATGVPRSVAPPSVEPVATVSAAVGQTRAAIAAALTREQIELQDTAQPFRNAESRRLAAAPRAVFQAILPDDPDGGYVVVYEFRDSSAAVDAGNEFASYLGTGAGRIQFPTDAQHTIRQLGTTLIVYSWAPSTSPDPGSPKVAAALATLGIGFAPPR
jgi:hypothetical protein